MMSKILLFIILVLCIRMIVPADPARAAEDGLPVYQRDRGTGLPTSMFGTYVRKGELLLYPFFEYYYDNDFEYKPAEMGYGLDQDFLGKYRASEGLIFLSYGFTDWLAVEIEGAIITATMEKAPDDPSATPEEIKESGTGDFEGQIRMRLVTENESRPEVFSYFEAVTPQQTDKVLIGTPDWEFKFGVGLVKGYTWGTATVRAAVEYSRDESKYEIGEYAVEYLKRLSSTWRVYAGIEGTQDEVELIAEAQWHVTDSIFVKINNAFGVTSKATDWAPEIGCVFSFDFLSR